MTYVDKKGYKRGKLEHSDLHHRQIAYEQIYLPNRQDYGLPFSKYVVHHKDENKLNNEVSNLQIVTQEDHEKIHGIKRNSDILSSNKLEQKLNSQNVNNLQERKIKWWYIVIAGLFLQSVRPYFGMIADVLLMVLVIYALYRIWVYMENP